MKDFTTVNEGLFAFKIFKGFRLGIALIAISTDLHLLAASSVSISVSGFVYSNSGKIALKIFTKRRNYEFCRNKKSISKMKQTGRNTNVFVFIGYFKVVSP